MTLKFMLENAIKSFVKDNTDLKDKIANAEYNEKNFNCRTVINKDFYEETYEMLKEIMLDFEFTNTLCPIANETERILLIYALDVDKILYNIYPAKQTSKYLYIELDDINALEDLISADTEQFKKIDDYRVKFVKKEDDKYETYFIIFGVLVLLTLIGSAITSILHFFKFEAFNLRSIASTIENKLQTFKQELLKVKLLSLYAKHNIKTNIKISEKDLINKDSLKSKIDSLKEKFNRNSVFYRYVTKLENKLRQNNI